MELKLGRVESKDRAIGASSLSAMNGESNGIMEGETESRMRLFTALAAVEEVCLKEFNSREQS
jgi:hypothetical protein